MGHALIYDGAENDPRIKALAAAGYTAWKYLVAAAARDDGDSVTLQEGMERVATAIVDALENAELVDKDDHTKFRLLARGDLWEIET